MALTPGTRLGVYEITGQIGEGGMGQVFRATDSNLKRSVAIKVLPASVAGDADRLARFQREAEVLAALNHPNIAAIYGLEKTPDFTALVMELVEGDDLSQRIACGPIPIDEALPIAKQIVDALEAAHEQGIIHRDLKPANIKVRSDGTVKVLDFGLAKAMEPVAGSSPSVSQSPTITTPAMTQAGMILGTAAYMSPEQARGRVVDKRADIWSFGAVLYEMLTSTRAFEGEDLADTLGAVIHKEPVWSRLPTATSAAVRTVLQRCLQKDPKQRLRDIGDVRLALHGAFDAESTSLQQTPARPPPLWRRLAVYSGPALLAGGLIVGTVSFATRPAPPRVTRTSIAAAGSAALTIAAGSGRDLAITPDGSRIVYVGNSGTELFVRALDASEPVAIATGQIGEPFVSPDGQWVGFVESLSTLKKVAISGGPSIVLASFDASARGATWLADDTIVFATNNPSTGLQRVSASGGTPTVVTRPDHTRGEADHVWPEALPGGGAVLLTITAPTGGLDAGSIAVFDLRTNVSTILVRGGSDAHYVPSGFLVYAAAGALRAVPFDLGRLAVRGPPVPVVPRLVRTNFGAGDYGIASDGTLVYVEATGSPAPGGRTLVWVDRMGNEDRIAAPPRLYQAPRLSPNGTQIALALIDEAQDIWVWDLRRSTLRRLTSDPGLETFPVWMPDSRRIVYASTEGGTLNLWWQAVDGTGSAERLTTSANLQWSTSVSSDGMQLVFSELTLPTMGRDLLRLTLDGARRVTPLLQTPFNEQNGVVSPDGHWLAYESDSAGRFEIFVRPFPNAAAGQSQVSTTGGRHPAWAGKELFFFGADGALMGVPVEATATNWNAGAPTKLLEPGYYTGSGNPNRWYDVSPDGRRFLMIKAGGADGATAPPSVSVVQHFDEELKRLVPAK